MKKKNVTPPSGEMSSPTDERRREMLDLCYRRLRELIPECTSEVNLLKCIEILEKHERSDTAADSRATLSVIADTLDRLAALDR
ncbi:MAG: hypothetical protein IJY36_01755 [Coprobacter sp.]|nr:hypothetical protein [Coprobacter sp.]